MLFTFLSHFVRPYGAKVAEHGVFTLQKPMNKQSMENALRWLLISNEGMLEPEAHRFLEKEAMDRCITKKSVAEEIIKKYRVTQ